MTENFYRSFEDKFRGSRQVIKDRLRAYQPFIAALSSLDEHVQAIDLGCGRGEWLELLTENGFNARGVDLDDGMLAACRELGLQVETKDALLALQSLPDASQTIVSGFHIAEHLPFEVLLALVKQAYRVLKPAGLLILETPNAENIMVGTIGFYTDPTHERPLPPALLEFLPEYVGFKRIKIIRLQEQPALASKSQLDLMDVLGGSSPDYAVVAQKSADLEILATTATVFEQDYGLPIGRLASQYDRQHHEQVQQIQRTAEAALAKAIEAQAQSAQAQAQSAQAHAQTAQAHAALHAIRQSRSWRLTHPLRWLGLQARLLRDKGVRARVVALTRKLGIHGALRALYLRASGKAAPFPPDVRPIHLSPRAEAIYDALKTAIQQHGDTR